MCSPDVGDDGIGGAILADFFSAFVYLSLCVENGYFLCDKNLNEKICSVEIMQLILWRSNSRPGWLLMFKCISVLGGDGRGQGHQPGEAQPEV